MIFYSGLGFLVLVIVFGFSLAFNLAFNHWWGAGYWDTHQWPFAVSLFPSGIVCWTVGSFLCRRPKQVLIDTETGEKVVVDRGNHTFFFLPMDLWGPLLIVIGLVVLVVDLFK